jgi:small subunit ribosomal protein S4
MAVGRQKFAGYKNMKKAAKCKTCRRLGAKLFLKGDRCFTTKCPMIRRPYPPGMKSRMNKGLSQYGREFKEKQKLKKWYGLKEVQFKNYVQDILSKRSSGKSKDSPTLLIQKLESRFDNVIFKTGLVNSRALSRQLISHGHFLINGKKVNIPSYHLKIGDKINVSDNSLKKNVFKTALASLEKKTPPSWILIDAKKGEATIKSFPSLEEVAPPVEISLIFEFYSR